VLCQVKNQKESAKNPGISSLAEDFRSIQLSNSREDTGITYYPTGYIFTSGEMVSSFEDTVKALEEYEVSQPVESDYGIHIIIRLPFDPDAIMNIASSGSQTARECAASTAYEDALAAKVATAEVVYATDFKAPNLVEFEKK